MVADIVGRYRDCFTDAAFRRSFLPSLIFFGGSLVFIFYMIGYATTKAVGSTTLLTSFFRTLQHGTWDGCLYKEHFYFLSLLCS